MPYCSVRDPVLDLVTCDSATGRVKQELSKSRICQKISLADPCATQPRSAVWQAVGAQKFGSPSLDLPSFAQKDLNVDFRVFERQSQIGNLREHTVGFDS